MAKTGLGALAVSAFCEDLAMMLAAGIQVDEALTLISGDGGGGPLGQAAAAVLAGVQAGAPLAEAVEKTGLFPAYAAQLIAAGEDAGRTEEVLRRLAAYYVAQDKLEKKLKSAVVYPAVLLFLMSAVLAVLVVRVLPVFSGVYTSLTGSVAASSYSYILAADIMGWAALCVVLLLTLLLLAGAAVLRSRRGGRAIARLLEKLPFTATASRRVAQARFLTTLATMVASGLDTDLSLSRAAGMVAHSGLRAQLQRCQEEMAGGRSLAQAFYDNGVLEPLYARMLQSGARAGQLDEVLFRLAGLFTEEANGRVGAVIDGVEPALAGFLTVSVGATLLAVMLPLVGILTSIG